MSLTRPEERHRRDVIGLVPAAGRGTRLGRLPFSKELYPIRFEATSGGQPRQRVACEWLFDSFRAAAIEKVCIVTRPDKWDIPAYLTDGRDFGLALSYIVVPESPSQSHSVDFAYPFVRDYIVAVGFADIVFTPRDIFVRLLSTQVSTAADVVLGVIAADRPQKQDMLDLDTDGRVRDIVIKPAQTGLRYTWLVAVWTPVFSEFLRGHLRVLGSQQLHAETQETYLGAVFLAALRKGLRVETTVIDDARSIDIGTPEDLARALRDDALRNDKPEGAVS